MAAQKGKAILLKVSDGATPTPAFGTVGGIRSRNISLNTETIDITNSDSANEWRELLDGGGLRTASISGSGVFQDDAQDETVRTLMMGGTVRDWQLVVPDFGTFEGPFQVTSLEYSGEYNGEAAYSISLESAGELTYTAV